MSPSRVASVPRSFRVALSAAALLAWGLVPLLARHESAQPALLGRYSLSYFALLTSVSAAALLLSLARTPALLPRVYARRWATLSLATSLILGIGLSEAAVRTTDLLGASYYEEITRYGRDREPDPELVYRQPASRTLVYQGVEVRTNERGFRDRPVLPRAPGELRVLVLGDSMAYGWGVAQEAIFPVLLEARLAARLDRPVRVINTGVCSYNTSQQLALLKRDGPALDPDFVILVYVSNDIVIHDSFYQHAEPAWREMPATGKIGSLLQKLWTFRIANHLILRRHGLLWNLERQGIRPEKTEGWRASMAGVRELRALTAARGQGFAVFLARFQATPEQESLLRALREAAGPAFADDASRWFRDRPLEELTNSRVDGHPNARGHAIYAERIAEQVLSRLGDR